MNQLLTPGARCAEHPAFEADYCPSCGTARPVGMTTEEILATCPDCPVCGAALVRAFTTTPNYVRCPRCGHVYPTTRQAVAR